MSTSVTFNNTSYSIPAGAEFNWAALSSFLIDVGNNGQTTNKQIAGMRVATSSPVTVAAATDFCVVTKLSVAGSVTVNLPAGANGQILAVVDGTRDAATNNITINRAGSDTINGATSLVLDHNGQAVILQYSSTGTDWRVLVNCILPGTITSADLAAAISIAKGGTGQTTKTAGYDALSPTTTKGDLVVNNGTNNVRQGVGSNGQALVADSAQTTGIKWAAVMTNPLTTLGDIVYEDATPTPTRLAGNTTSTKKFLTQTGTGSVSAVPAWDTIVAGDLPNVTQAAAGAVASAGQLLGTNTNDDASAGNVGEYTSVVGTWTPVTTAFVSTSAMSLTAGDWDVELITISEGNFAAGTTGVVFGVSTDSTAGTFSDTDTSTAAFNTSFATANNSRAGGSLTVRKSLSTTTNIYGKAKAAGANASGANPYFMRARRVR